MSRRDARYFLRYWVAAAEEKGEEYLDRHMPGRPPLIPDHLAMLCSYWCQEGHVVKGQREAFKSFAQASSAVC